MRTFIFLFLFLLIVDFPLFLFLGSLLDPGGAFILLGLTGLLGVWALFTGARSWRQPGRKGGQIDDPSRLLLEWGLDLVAGVSLIVPGPISDVVGLLLLLPPVRNLVLPRLRRRLEKGRWAFFGGGTPGGPFSGGFTTGTWTSDGESSPQAGPDDSGGENRESPERGSVAGGVRDVNFEILPESDEAEKRPSGD